MATHKEEHQWVIVEGALQRTFEFQSFSEALAFTLQVGNIAEANKHHPDILIQYSIVILRLYTHDQQNKVTAKDHGLAKKIDSFYSEQA